MAVQINESVVVGAVFERQCVRPVWLRWEGRHIRLVEVTMTWQATAGRTIWHYFTTTDGVNSYELRLDSEQLRWELTQVDGEG